MGKVAKIKFKVRKFFAKIKVRRLLAKDAAATTAAANVAHEERLAQVQRVDGTEHKIERSMDVMVAARRSVYGAHMLPQTTQFGVSVEEARELHEKQKAAAAQDGGGIWDGTQTSNQI
ncbi:mei2-like protein [Fusarium tjaetaba]|uniref:Mei2-like protein n=1 Tax=Fusarium tjaetaba TaxID=1567544 RepID=A0A8H5W6V2_9HYPO|nr:mei2-like protein [Fusarium tjaetaba]KAF5647510.1 mei2-like protein [Fusarium tjaetaba]